MSSMWAKGCLLNDCVCYLTLHDYISLVEGERHGILLFLLLFVNVMSSEMEIIGCF